ncbi:MAG: hypothetical protein ACYCOO_12055, partial [Chitinophagaceae bacterium]
MADKKKDPLHHDLTLQESVNKVEIFYEKNSNVIHLIGLAIVLLVGGYFGYRYLYLAPREKKAQGMVFKAQQYLALDSFNTALNGDGN